MMPPQIEIYAQAAVGRILNAVPEGILIAVFAWAVLRALPRQNSRTRFAVWFAALLAVTALPLLGHFEGNIAALTSRASGFSFAIHLPAHWAAAIFALWLVAAAVAITRLAVGLWQLRELRKSCTPVNVGEMDLLLQRTLAELQTASGSLLDRPVTLASSERVRVPAAIGYWKPMIVLPAWTLREVSASDLGIVLRHEFAHLRRWDDWTNLVQKIARAVFFFHPAVWWIENRLSVEREMACDDTVLAETGNPDGYANCLVTLLEKSVGRRNWSMAQALVHRTREAALRLTQILDRNRPTSTRVSRPVLGAVCAFGFVCLLAVQHAPQFVTFVSDAPATVAHDRGAGPVLAESVVGPAAMVKPAMLPLQGRVSDHPARVVASSWHSRVAPVPKKKAMTSPALIAKSAEEKNKASDATEARVSANTGMEMAPWVEFAALAGPDITQDFAPDFARVPQSVVFVESTEYMGSDVRGVWMLRVWRILVLKPDMNRQMAAPAASST